MQVRRICPTDRKALGYLPKGERRRRANEIVEASGVNDAKQFVENQCRYNVSRTGRVVLESFSEPKTAARQTRHRSELAVLRG